MRKVLRLMCSVALAAAVGAGFVVPSASADDGSDDADDGLRMYEVTIVDLTSGQPLTPPLVNTHRAKVEVFTVGKRASFRVKEIAENGNLAPLMEALARKPGVAEVVAGATPLVPTGLPGAAMFPDRVTLEIHARPGTKKLSWVSMLICTNDGFTGADDLTLPRQVGDVVTATHMGYDAGTEINTEDFADIVPPCQELVGVSSGEPGTGVSNPALAEGGVIHHHEGIEGGADLLPEVHGWDVNAPVAMITVERTA